MDQNPEFQKFFEKFEKEIVEPPRKADRIQANLINILLRQLAKLVRLIKSPF
jgi:hypothetical protein